MSDSDELLGQLQKLLGPDGVREQPDDFLPDIIVKPRNTAEVAGILALCHKAGQPIVPIGGKSGLVNGTMQTGDELGLSLERMNVIEEIDTANRTMTVQAGCILQIAAEAAEDKNLLLPMDLGARGSATIGGNVATNAGGNMVLRYGMMRDLVLGMEVVLADGTVVSSMNKMLKNNTGYDLKQWFIGAEGTLGVITRLVLRLRPLPTTQNTALLALDEFASVAALLHWLDGHTAGTLCAYEVMWPAFYHYVTREGGNHRPPLPHGSPYYVLVETRGSSPQTDADSFEVALADAMEQGMVADAVLSKSQAERNALWEIRDDVLDFFQMGPLIPFDISITIDRMEQFVSDLQAGMVQFPTGFCIVFGHLGDSNLHVLLGTSDAAQFDAEALETLLYDLVEGCGGSVSAEHGIGVAKRDHLRRSRSPQELQLMINMKKMLDPANILNPGKIFAASQIVQGGDTTTH